MHPSPASPQVEHPNLQLAVTRLRRMQWVWAVLFALLGGLAMASSGPTQPLVPLTWITIAAFLAVGPQPIYLALVAVAWGLSLIFLIPGISQALGTDPVTRLLGGGLAEVAASAIVRAILLVTAWHQFLFYRLLYGTQQAAGLDPALPPIPSVIPNPSDRIAVWARWVGFVGVMAALVSIPLSQAELRANLLGLAYGTAVFAVGLGVGVAFVPTQRRGTALIAIALGCAALLAALLVGRALGRV
jgi:hypothetical protein